MFPGLSAQSEGWFSCLNPWSLRNLGALSLSTSNYATLRWLPLLPSNSQPGVSCDWISWPSWLQAEVPYRESLCDFTCTTSCCFPHPNYTWLQWAPVNKVRRTLFFISVSVSILPSLGLVNGVKYYTCAPGITPWKRTRVKIKLLIFLTSAPVGGQQSVLFTGCSS
jgi:hypothetical protein